MAGNHYVQDKKHFQSENCIMKLDFYNKVSSKNNFNDLCLKCFENTFFVQETKVNLYHQIHTCVKQFPFEIVHVQLMASFD